MEFVAGDHLRDDELMINWTFVRQVGFVPWALRYSTRQFQKRILRRDSRLRLPTGGWITLPRQSASATEVYVTNANIDWGAEALFARFASRDRNTLRVRFQKMRLQDADQWTKMQFLVPPHLKTAFEALVGEKRYLGSERMEAPGERVRVNGEELLPVRSDVSGADRKSS